MELIVWLLYGPSCMGMREANSSCFVLPAMSVHLPVDTPIRGGLRYAYAALRERAVGLEFALVVLSAALLDFEDATEPEDEPSLARAERLKSHGNALFKLRDASAALSYYVSALKALSEAPRLRSASIFF